MSKIEPLKDGWKPDEDKGFVPDQIKDRVNTESNYAWAKKSASTPIPFKEKIAYNLSIGRNYLSSKY